MAPQQAIDPVQCSVPGCEYTTPKGLTDHAINIEYMSLHTQAVHTVQSGPSRIDQLSPPAAKRPRLRLRTPSQDAKDNDENVPEDSRPKSFSRVKFYKMDHKKRGKAIVFNHKRFKARPGQTRAPQERFGTDKDAKDLKKALDSFGYETRIENDLSKAAIDNVMENLSEEDHTDSDSVVVAVLSHGDKGTICAKDKDYDETELFAWLLADKCPTLAKKPKIIIIQACRGESADRGVVVTEASKPEDASVEEDVQAKTTRVPVHADFLIARATPSGYLSMRHTQKGSFFIQALCKVLNEDGETDDLVSLLTMVNDCVAQEDMKLEVEPNVLEQRKQVACYTSTTTKKIQLTKK